MKSITAVLLVLLVWISVARSQDGESRESLAKRIEAVRERYQRWGMTVTHRTNPHAEDIASFDAFVKQRNVQWSEDGKWTNRILRNGTRFRMEKTNNEQPESVAFDGTVLRERTEGESYNGPLDVMQASGGGRVAVDVADLPHKLTPLFHVRASLDWVYGHAKPMLKYGTEFEIQFSPVSAPLETEHTHVQRIEEQASHYVVQAGDQRRNLTIASEQLAGVPCISLWWTEDEHYTRSVWLSEEHDLLPIRAEVTSPDYREFMQITEFTREGEQWFPAKMRYLSQYTLGTAEIGEARFSIEDGFAEESAYGSLPWIRLPMPPPAAPGTGAGPAIAPPGNRNLFCAIAPKPSWLDQVVADPFAWLAGFALAPLLAMCVALPATIFAKGRERMRSFQQKHARLLAVIGLALMMLVALQSCFLSGWWEHGVALMAIGFVGMTWSAFVFVLRCQPRVEIRSVLWFAVCTALTFAGYSRGINEYAARQRMVREVTAAGGQVEFRSFDQDHTLQLPFWMIRLLGNGYAENVVSVSLPLETFTAANVRRWHFDDVRSLVIRGSNSDGQLVSRDAFAALPKDTPLATVYLQTCTFDDASVEALTRFPALRSLHFPCDGQPIPKTLSRLSRLRSLSLVDVAIDDDFATLVEPFSSNCQVYLSGATFRPSLPPPDARPDSFFVVEGSLISPETMEYLGAFEGSVFLFRSRFAIGNAQRLELANVEQFRIRGGTFSDSDLMKLSPGAKCRSCGFSRTQVTAAGMEAFTQAHPEIGITVSP